MGNWLRGHEGERDNCFSKIQLVGQTKPSSWYVCNVMPGIEEVAESNEDFPSRENSSPSTAWGLNPPPPPHAPTSFKPALNGVNIGFKVAPLLYHCFMSTVQMGLQSLILLVVFLLYSGTSLIRSTMGQKKIVRIDEGFFFTRNVWPFCQVAKKGAVKRGDHITKVAVRRGSTVLKFLDFQHVFQLTILDFACKYIIKRDAHGSVQTPPKSGWIIHEKVLY